MRPPSFTSSPRAFTLIEVVIAITLFAALSTMGVMVLSEVSKASKKVEMEEYLYTEGQHLLERIAREVQNNGIDYEEYYSRMIVQNGSSGINRTFGENYDQYHRTFFNPGSGGPSATEYQDFYGGNNYGGLCTDGSTTYSTSGSCNLLFSTADYETGVRPYNGSGYDPDSANAFCDEFLASYTNCTNDLSYHQTNQLFLINKNGTERTYFVRERGRIAMVELDGTDSDNDGLIDTWECDTDFTCNGSDGTGTDNLPYPGDLAPSDDVDDEDFYVISPKNLGIDEVSFYISPLEDPFKAYGETDSATFASVQLHPKVTIVLTLTYISYDSAGNPVDFTGTGDAPTMTLQTTVSTGNRNVIDSYSFP
jgi:prepilin-type N-terminal cleavage/methylation domain-containing protein